MIVLPTQRNSQISGRELRDIPLKYCFAYCLYSDVHPASTNSLRHLGLSLSNPLEQINPPYPIWKGTSLASIWGIVACSIPRGCTDIAWLCDPLDQPSYFMQCTFVQYEIKQAMWLPDCTSTPFIIGSEVDVSCVFVFGPWRWLDQNQNTLNVYLRTDDKRCRALYCIGTVTLM